MAQFTAKSQTLLAALLADPAAGLTPAMVRAIRVRAAQIARSRYSTRSGYQHVQDALAEWAQEQVDAAHDRLAQINARSTAGPSQQ